MKKVTVTSNKDYDATHPAGTDLSDVMDIAFRSIKEPLDNDFDKVKLKGVYHGHTLILKEPLTQFNSEHRKLLGSQYALFARQKPVDGLNHIITVTLEYENGNKYSATSKAMEIF